VVTQPNQGAAVARVHSAGDTADRDKLTDDLEKYEPWESWDSSRRNGCHPPFGTGQKSGGSDDDDNDYFAGDLYQNLEARRSKIREHVDGSTACIYAQFLFYPSSSLGNENVREPSQASH
jgi:hypothetical protein